MFPLECGRCHATSLFSQMAPGMKAPARAWGRQSAGRCLGLRDMGLCHQESKRTDQGMVGRNGRGRNVGFAPRIEAYPCLKPDSRRGGCLDDKPVARACLADGHARGLRAPVLEHRRPCGRGGRGIIHEGGQHGMISGGGRVPIGCQACPLFSPCSPLPHC
jgi:hypothetical protein